MPLTIEKGRFIRDFRPRPLRRTAAAGTDRRPGRQRLHPLGDAARPRLPGAEAPLPPPQGQLWHRMAEPAAESPRTSPRPSCSPPTASCPCAPATPTGCSPPRWWLTPACPHRRRARLFPGDRKGAGAGRLRAGHPATRPERRLHGDHRFARTAVLQHADEIVQAVRDGKLRRFFLVGGCDGTRPSRRYYTEFARLTPPDTILLTLACRQVPPERPAPWHRAGHRPAPHPGRGPVQRRLQRHRHRIRRWPTPLAAASTTCPSRWCCAGLSRRPCASSSRCWRWASGTSGWGLPCPVPLAGGGAHPAGTVRPQAHCHPGSRPAGPFWAGEVSFGYFATNSQLKISDSAQGIFPVFIHSTKKWRWGLRPSPPCIL